MCSGEQKVIKLVTTCFYIGYLPLMPGTYASMLGVLLYVLVKDSAYAYGSMVLLVTGAGFLFSGRAEKAFSEKDSSKIVIDELSAMLLCFCFVKFYTVNLIAGFILFRIFDIVKPYPIRNLQKLHGSAGIMLDDIVAALYTNISLRLIHYCILSFA